MCFIIVFCDQINTWFILLQLEQNDQTNKKEDRIMIIDDYLHLADTFIQSDLQIIKDYWINIFKCLEKITYSLISKCVISNLSFPQYGSPLLDTKRCVKYYNTWTNLAWKKETT